MRVKPVVSKGGLRVKSSNVVFVSEKKLEALVAHHTGKPGALLSILEDAQKLHRHKFLPQRTLEYIAEKTDIPLSRIYGVVNFYAFFNLKPQGDHVITFCRGTACHTRGSKDLLDYLKGLLRLKDEGVAGDKVFLTTPDNKFTVKTVACFGQCALAPVIDADGVIHSRMTRTKLCRLIKDISRRKSR
jgi:NADH-quinone oxidoreductase subunit E